MKDMTVFLLQGIISAHSNIAKIHLYISNLLPLTTSDPRVPLKMMIKRVTGRVLSFHLCTPGKTRIVIGSKKR